MFDIKNFGYHMSGETTVESIGALSSEYNSTQIFTAGFKTQFRKVDFEEASAFRDIVRDRSLNVVSHMLLSTNFVSEDNRKRIFSINLLASEVKRCKSLGIKYIVIHPGSASDPEAITRLAKSIDDLFERLISYNTSWDGTLLVENMAGTKDMVPMYPAQYDELFSKVNKKYVKNVGIVIDTAHAWGLGVALSTYVSELKKYGIFDKVKVIHFNNNSFGFGTKRERHTKLLEGKIPEAELQEFSKEFPDNTIFIVEES